MSSFPNSYVEILSYHYDYLEIGPFMEVKLNEVGHKSGTQNNRTGVLVSKGKDIRNLSFSLCA